MTAIVCTYNRAPQLSRCLQSFHHIQARPETWQLLVVDNNSSDETRETVFRFAASAPFRVNYAFEPRQGLSHARNRGIAEATTPYIAFTDDDCQVDAGWIDAIQREFVQDPTLMVLGGRVVPAPEHPEPLGTRIFPDPLQITSFDQLFARMIGCNMAYSKIVFTRIGLFDTRFGKGAPLQSAEDVDLMYRALKNQLSILYAPNVAVRHMHNRVTAVDIQQVRDGYIKGRGGFYLKHLLSGDLVIARQAAKELWDLSQAAITRSPRRAAARALAYLTLGGVLGLVRRG